MARTYDIEVDLAGGYESPDFGLELTAAEVAAIEAEILADFDMIYAERRDAELAAMMANDPADFDDIPF